MSCCARIRILFTIALAAACAPAPAQRVQVPELNGTYNGQYNPAPPATYAPGPGSASPVYGAPSFDPYATPGTGTPPANVPYSFAPPPGNSGVMQAPAAPYSGGGYPQPAAPYAPQPTSGWGDTNPFAWENGTYGFETADGSTFRYQKFFQEVAFEHTYLYGDHSVDALELHRLDIWSTVAFPLWGNIDAPLLLTPGFAFNWFEGPVTIPTMTSSGADLPSRIYDAYLDVAWNPQPSPFFGAELGVRTGVWTDFKEVNGDSVRVLGRGLAKFRVAPNLDILVGAVYLDRVRVKVLPAGGFRFRPNETWDVDLVFPNPKVRRRLPSVGTVDWTHFVAAEYGGGSWTVRRLTGADRIDYNDIRISTGLEWENQRQVRGHFEVGVVFDREVIFDSADPPKYTPDTTVMLRGGVDF